MHTRRERVLSFLTLAALTAMFVIGVALPGRRTAAAARDEIRHAQNEIARAPRLIEQCRAARLELDRRHRYLVDSAAAVAPADPHGLLGRISQLARASELTVSRLEPEPVRQRESYAEHPFRLDFRGQLGPLSDFLRGLEDGPRLYAIDDLTVRNAAGNVNREDLEGTIRFTVFATLSGYEGFTEESDSTAIRQPISSLMPTALRSWSAKDSAQ